MKFTRRTDYALRIMEALARSGEGHLISMRSFGEYSGISVKFLQSVVGDLVKKQLVRTKLGPKGGITLGQSIEQITVLDIVEAVEGPINLMECLEAPNLCQDFENCSIMGVMYSAQNALRDSLKKNTLASMINEKKKSLQLKNIQGIPSSIVYCPAIDSSGG